METPFIIYIKAVGIYALITIPALGMPVMYLISMMYVFLYGWFAWAVFTIIYLAAIFCNPGFKVENGYTFYWGCSRRCNCISNA
jgi:hypothetical protein